MAVESMFGDMRSLMEKFRTTQNNVTLYKGILDEIQEELKYELGLNKHLVEIVQMLMTERLALYRQHNSIITKLKWKYFHSRVKSLSIVEEDMEKYDEKTRNNKKIIKIIFL